MKIAYFIAPIAVLMSATAFAGHPIIMPLERACKQANMVIIADVSQSRKVPEEGIDPFNPKYSKWNDFGFSQCADISKMSTLISDIHVEPSPSMAGHYLRSRPNKVTGANAGGSRRLVMRTPWAARVA